MTEARREGERKTEPGAAKGSALGAGNQRELPALERMGL